MVRAFHLNGFSMFNVQCSPLNWHFFFAFSLSLSIFLPFADRGRQNKAKEYSCILDELMMVTTQQLTFLLASTINTLRIQQERYKETIKNHFTYHQTFVAKHLLIFAFGLFFFCHWNTLQMEMRTMLFFFRLLSMYRLSFLFIMCLCLFLFFKQKMRESSIWHLALLNFGLFLYILLSYSHRVTLCSLLFYYEFLSEIKLKERNKI